MIWDIDDVLVDTTLTYRTSREVALQVLGIPSAARSASMAIWDRLFWYFDQDDTVGMLRAVIHELGFEIEDLPTRLELAILAFNDVWANGIVVVDGMDGLVAALYDSGTPQGVVSSGSPDRQTRKLANVGLAEYFSASPIVIVPSDSPLAKPRPEGILKVCRDFGIPPERAVYVGDRASDVVAANLARAVSVFFKRSPPPPEVRRAPQEGAISLELPLHVVSSAADLTTLLSQLL